MQLQYFHYGVKLTSMRIKRGVAMTGIVAVVTPFASGVPYVTPAEDHGSLPPRSEETVTV